jgi:hypothetical protein
MSAKPTLAWSCAFDPIVLSDGRVLRTLHDAGHYAAALPKAAQEQPQWQTAAGANRRHFDRCNGYCEVTRSVGTLVSGPRRSGIVGTDFRSPLDWSVRG